MHEMSLVSSILDIANEELAKRQLTHLTRVVVHCGQLSNVVADSLLLCFEVLTKGTMHENAVLEVITIPLSLRCRHCGQCFTGEGQEALWQPCPLCNAQCGHDIVQGKEFFIQQLEAE